MSVNKCDEVCVDKQQKTSVNECVVTFAFSLIMQNNSHQMNFFGIYYLLGSLVSSFGCMQIENKKKG